MKFEKIELGVNVEIDPSTTFNNVAIGDHVRIAKRCSIYGGSACQLEIGAFTYIGMNSVLNGFSGKVKIGKHVSIAQNVNVMADSGPNASERMQRLFPIQKGSVTIGDHTWIGASVVIGPNVSLGKCCVVGANSFVNKSFPDYSIIAGNPCRLIRSLTEEEIKKLHQE